MRPGKMIPKYTVTFKCPHCGEEVTVNYIEIGYLDANEEYSTEAWAVVTCPKCHKESEL